MAVVTSDLYEACLVAASGCCSAMHPGFYLVHGCDLESIEGTLIGGEIICRMTFSGAELEHLQTTYLHGQAEINLFQFRRAYRELTTTVMRTKKKAKELLRKGGL